MCSSRSLRAMSQSCTAADRSDKLRTCCINSEDSSSSALRDCRSAFTMGSLGDGGRRTTSAVTDENKESILLHWSVLGKWSDDEELATSLMLIDRKRCPNSSTRAFRSLLVSAGAWLLDETAILELKTSSGKAFKKYSIYDRQD